MIKEVNKESTEGFSLIEVMMAISFITIGILGVSSSFLSASHLSDQINQSTLAIFAATEVIDEVSMGIDPDTKDKRSVAALNGATFDVSGLRYVPGAGDPLKPGSVSVTVNPDNTAYLVTVTILISHKNLKKQTSYQLNTILPIS